MASTKKQTKSALDHLKSHTIVVADTGDFESMKEFKPTDATTNPSLILQAANIDKYQALIDQAVEHGATVEGDINDKVNGEKTRPEIGMVLKGRLHGRVKGTMLGAAVVPILCSGQASAERA